MNIKELFEKEIKGCFDFFWNESNQDMNSKGFGLTIDSSRRDDMASIAANGFGLSAYVIGVKRGYITFEQGYERVLHTLKTIYENVDKEHGFYIHFVHMNTAENYGKNHKYKSEYSTIDTAILLMGAISAAEFFKKDIKILVDQMLNEADWHWLIDPNKPVFRMAYHGEDDRFQDGWSKSYWNHYAEQLMMYFLYAGQESTSEENARKLYFGFDRHLGSYKGKNHVYCYDNALFIHQFSHMFIDFETYVDGKMFNWFENSVEATLSNYQYCKDHHEYKTFEKGYWGLSAMHNKNGYLVCGAPPWGFTNIGYINKRIDGTVAPYASLSSMIFTPELSQKALASFSKDEKMWGKYGLFDSFNFEGDLPWYSNTYIGIDKGPTIIMLDNYENQTIMDLVTNSEFIQKALKKLGFVHKDQNIYDKKG